MQSSACTRISQTPRIMLCLAWPSVCMSIYVFASFFQSFDVLNVGHEFKRLFACTHFCNFAIELTFISPGAREIYGKNAVYLVWLRVLEILNKNIWTSISMLKLQQLYAKFTRKRLLTTNSMLAFDADDEEDDRSGSITAQNIAKNWRYLFETCNI